MKRVVKMPNKEFQNVEGFSPGVSGTVKPHRPIRLRIDPRRSAVPERRQPGGDAAAGAATPPLEGDEPGSESPAARVSTGGPG